MLEHACPAYSSIPSSSCTRASILTASSEWPPRSKKSSSIPTRSTPSTSRQIAASASSTGVSRRHVGASRGRAGRRPAAAARARSSLPLARHRERVEHHERRRDHERRQLGLQQPAAAARRRAGCSRRRDDVGDEPLVAGAVLADDRDRGADDVVVAVEHRLDLAELDPEAAQLDLVVDAAEELERPVRAPAHEVAGPVQASPSPAANGSGDEPLRGQLGAVVVAARRRPSPPM